MLSYVQSTATQADELWYAVAVSGTTLYVLSETANKIEEWDVSVLETPVLNREYSTYDKQISI